MDQHRHCAARARIDAVADDGSAASSDSEMYSSFLIAAQYRRAAAARVDIVADDGCAEIAVAATDSSFLIAAQHCRSYQIC